MTVKEIDIPFATPIPKPTENTFTMFKYFLFSKMCGFPLLAMTH